MGKAAPLDLAAGCQSPGGRNCQSTYKAVTCCIPEHGPLKEVGSTFNLKLQKRKKYRNLLQGEQPIRVRENHCLAGLF